MNPTWHEEEGVRRGHSCGHGARPLEGWGFRQVTKGAEGTMCEQGFGLWLCLALLGSSESCRVMSVRPPQGVGCELLSETPSHAEHGPEIRRGGVFSQWSK